MKRILLNKVSFCVANDGTKLAFKILGPSQSVPLNSTPLIVVMGLSNVKEDGLRLFDVLCRHRLVLIFDNRGIGESDIPRPNPHPSTLRGSDKETAFFSATVSAAKAVAACTIEDLAKDVLCLAAHVGWERFHLMGHSMGGMISLCTASLAPSKVASLGLLASTPGGRDALSPNSDFFESLDSRVAMKTVAQGGRGLSLIGFVQNVQRFMYTPSWISSHYRDFEQLCADALKYTRSPRGVQMQAAAAGKFSLAKLNVAALRRIPTCILHGTEDLIIPFGNAAKLQAMLSSNVKVDVAAASNNLNFRGSTSSTVTVPAAGAPILCVLQGAGHTFWNMDNGEGADFAAAFLQGVDAISRDAISEPNAADISAHPSTHDSNASSSTRSRL
jgi:pimeloyl-ACP methyl ester carboxylesterase